MTHATPILLFAAALIAAAIYASYRIGRRHKDQRHKDKDHAWQPMDESKESKESKGVMPDASANVTRSSDPTEGHRAVTSVSVWHPEPNVVTTTVRNESDWEERNGVVEVVSQPSESSKPAPVAPVIAFVTTCKGRAHHIRTTLPRNLADNRLPNSKFILLDYASNDGLIPYLQSAHAADIASGRLTIYSHHAPGPFHVAHAKNMCARLGILEGADILVTLDADNFTGHDFDRFILDKFREPGIFLCPNHASIRSIPHGPGRPCRGYAGRLAVRAQDFLKAGGYDEAYDTWRGEDIDFNARMGRMGYQMRYIDNHYLEAIPHNTQERFREYPHAKQYDREGAWKITGRETVTVVNYGKFGMGIAYRNFGSTPVVLGPIATRVFGIGMHKTATTSLHKAFQILGFDSLHWGKGEAPLIWSEVNSPSSGGRSKTLEKWYSVCDLPIPILYKQLDKAYPGSKFILTVRDSAKWLTSVERLWDARYNPSRWEWDVWPISNTLHKAMYGRVDFDAATFLSRYHQHNEEVWRYFMHRPDDLLMLNVEAGQGWPELCRFLGVPIPDVSYPREYVTRLLSDWGHDQERT